MGPIIDIAKTATPAPMKSTMNGSMTVEKSFVARSTESS